MRHRHVQGKSLLSRARGSITVEASLVLPLFFLAAIIFMLLLEIGAISLRVRNGAQYAAQLASAEGYELPLAGVGGLKADLTEAVGRGGLASKLIVGGVDGISLSESTMDPATGIGTLRWKYRIRMPFPVFGNSIGEYEGELKYKAWNGYHGDGSSAEEEEMVYVAENGIVYHKDPSCTHLALSITSVSVNNLSTCRNENGGKYHACEKCGGILPSSGSVYIAKNGDCWHTDRNCSGLKRTVDKIPISQVGGRGPCSKCSQ